MIGKITYDEFKNIIQIIEKSNNNLKDIINYYVSITNVNSVKLDRFTQELDNYIRYLRSNYQINVDADKALGNLKELNS